jgi:hypothetical protein
VFINARLCCGRHDVEYNECVQVHMRHSIKEAARTFDGVTGLSCRLLPIQTMSSLAQTHISFLYRQEWLIQFGLGNVFYGVCSDFLIHMILMYR